MSRVLAPAIVLAAALCPALAISDQIAGGMNFTVSLKADGTVWLANQMASGTCYQGANRSQVRTSAGVPLTNIVAVSARGYVAVALASDGTVWSFSQSGSGGGSGFCADQIGGLTGVVAVSASNFSSGALKADGTVWTWWPGWAGPGQITESDGAPLHAVTSLAAGHLHRLALKSDGTVWAWGDNDVGQLGDGTTTPSSVPVQVMTSDGAPLSRVSAIAAGNYFGMALKTDGTVWTWGGNHYGQLGVGTRTHSSVAVQATLSGIAAIAAGAFHGLALTSGGVVYGWGNNDYGQVGQGVSIPTPRLLQQLAFPVVAIGAGDAHTIAVLPNGTLRQLGRSVATAPNLLAKGSAAIAAGSHHGMAVKSNGTLWQWGWNNYGQLGTGTDADSNIPVPVAGIRDLRAVAAKGYGALGLRSDGTLWTWGRNLEGELGTGATDPQSNVPVQVPSLTGVSAVAAGDLQGWALMPDGTLRGWGWNTFGQLGRETTGDFSGVPGAVSNLEDVKAMAASAYDTLALKSDGTVWGWGDARRGKLGIAAPDTFYSSVPIQILRLPGEPLRAVAVVAAGGALAALAPDGTVWAWGDNVYGELGQGDVTDWYVLPRPVIGLSDIKSIAAGELHLVALRSDGTVWAWGSNRFNQLAGTGGNNFDWRGDPISTVPVQVMNADGTPLSGVATIAAGAYFTSAFKADGTVWGWGSNYYGQLGDGTNTRAVFPVQVSGLLTYTTALTPGTGTGIAVGPDVSLSFETVQSAGGVVATPIEASSLPAPAGYVIVEGSAYDITTTAAFSGMVNVCLGYTPDLVPTSQQNLKLLHYVDSAWQDVTTSVDTAAKRVCGLTSSLSPFAVAFVVRAPVANAGTSQSVQAGSVVTVDGSGSSDPEGLVPLRYAWTFVSQPPESTAQLSERAEGDPEVTATFRPLVPGSYVLELTVTNTGGLSSSARVTVGVAGITVSAGADQVVDEGARVTLNGSTNAQDPSYLWEQIGGPPVALSSETTASPSFVAPDLSGGVGGNTTLTLRLTVFSNSVTVSATVNVTVKNVDHAPVANAGSDQTVNEGSPVALSAVGSYDPDGDPIASYRWEQIGGPAVTLSNPSTATPSFIAPLLEGGTGESAVLAFRLTASDGDLSGSDEVVVTVEQVNHPPVAEAGASQTRDEGSAVVLNGTGSADPDGDRITYAWVQEAGPTVALSDATTVTPSFTAPIVDAGGAELRFTLTVTDSGGMTGTDVVVVSVQNSNDPPACHLAQPSVALLWPPNHKMVPVRIVGVTDPQKDNVSIAVTGITQDEPVSGLGDGDTAPDGALDGAKALVRAERGGNGNGRVYRITFIAEDGWGETCTGAVTLGVPHNAKQVPVDDGERYDSTKP